MKEWNEKQLEEYTCQNFRSVVDALYDGKGKNVPAWILGRQIPTSGGIIDMLAVIDLDLYIIEFKAVRADQKALGQLQRYRSVVRHLNPYNALNRFELHDQPTLRAVEQLDGVRLMLIAPDFTKEALLGCDVCITATHNNGDFSYATTAYSDSHFEANPHLQNLIAPYLNYLVQRHRKQVKHREKDILVDSAVETAGHVN